jgi:hypothetical protein
VRDPAPDQIFILDFVARGCATHDLKKRGDSKVVYAERR